MGSKRSSVLHGVVVLIASLVVGPGMATATLIDNGTTTVDTATGLEWLDLTETNEMSFDEVSAQLGVGGTWEGYQHASLSDVEDLFANAGITPGMDGVLRPEDYVPVGDLLALMGVLKNEEPHGTTSDWSWGFTSDLQPGGSTTAVRLMTTSIAIPSFQGGSTYTQLLMPDFADPTLGSFLHRSAVLPEPSSAILWLGGLAGAVVFRRGFASGGVASSEIS